MEDCENIDESGNSGKSADEKAVQHSQHLLSRVTLRTLTGICHPANKGAVDWSRRCGLLAFGSHGAVVVVDPVTKQVAQVLDDHKSSVVKVSWTRTATKHLADRLTLASADFSGKILVWNVNSGEIKARFHVVHDLAVGGRVGTPAAIADMQWLGGDFENSGHLLLTLHAQGSLVLWDTIKSTKVWKTNFSGSFKGFSFDPFDASRMVLMAGGSTVMFINDFNVKKAPSGTFKRFHFEEEKTPKKMQKMRDKMLELVTMNDDRPSGNSDCIQVLFNKNERDVLMMVYPREVLVLDVTVGQVIGVVTVDKSNPAIIQAISCRQRDVIYLLYENGSISMRSRKSGYSHATCPTPSMSKSFSSFGVNTPSENLENFHLADFSNLLEVSYEQKALSESVRLSKNGKILGMAIQNSSERSVAVVSSEGRVTLLDIVPSGFNNNTINGIEDLQEVMTDDSLRFFTSGIITGLGPTPFVVRMCPPLTTKNMEEYKPLMAVGLPNGNIQVVNMASGRIEREFATHTYGVQNIEWTGMHSILSAARQQVSGSSSLVRNELVHTDIRTGTSRTLRSHRSEEPPIDMIRVSHLKQYFIVAFVGAPFELWDLRSLNLLRTMPKKFPPITALDWSPLHNLKHLKKKELEKQEKMRNEKENTPDSKPDEKGNGSSGNQRTLQAKEHFVFTDPEGQLYHFSVEGNTIKDGTKIAAEHGLGTVTSIVWKSDHIVRGDAEGNINVWDIKTKTTRPLHTKRGMIKKMRFAPGRGNMKMLVLHHESVAIWDIKEGEVINEIRAPKELVSRPIDVDWAASDRPVIATNDGCLRIMGLALTSSTVPLMDYERDDEPIACLSLLPNKIRNNLEILLHHQPWKKERGDPLEDLGADDGMTPEAIEWASKMLHELGLDHIKSPVSGSDPKSLMERYRQTAKLSGLFWESDFWTVAKAVICGQEVDKRFDLVCGNQRYYEKQVEVLTMHENRAGSPELKEKVIDKLLCLGLTDKAVRLLLDADSSSASYYTDSLRACLVASTSVNADDPNSTVKLVATNLIAEGKLWEGVQLLCLIGKVTDACQYLQSSGEWDASIWLAKCRLPNEQDFVKIVSKYCDHCIARGLRRKSIMLKLSIKDYVGVLDTLIAGKMVVLAAQFLHLVKDELKMIPDTSHVMVISEEISLCFARHLFDCGNVNGAFFYCDKADEKGEMLRKEFEILMSKGE